MATRIDTLKTYEAIAAAGVDDKAARAISNAIAEAATDWRADLATKSDLDAMVAATKADLATMRSDMKSGFDTIKLETRADIDKLGLRLEGLIASTQNRTLVWMFGMLLAFAGVILAGFKFL